MNLGIDENTIPLSTSFASLRSLTISRAQLYLVLVEFPLICGMHAIVLFGCGGDSMEFISSLRIIPRPSNTLGTGWGVGLRTKGRGDYSRHNDTAHGYPT